MDPPWAHLQDKWDAGIELTTAISKDINDFIKAKATIYKGECFYEKALQGIFKNDFKGFTSTYFCKANYAVLENLRSCLQRGGVFVPADVPVSTSDSETIDVVAALRITLREKTKHIWTKADVDSISKTFVGKKLVFSPVHQRLGLLDHLNITQNTGKNRLATYLDLSQPKSNLTPTP